MMTDITWTVGTRSSYLAQPPTRLSLWCITHGTPTKQKQISRLVEDGEMPDSVSWLSGSRVGALLVYVDDILGAGPKPILTGPMDAIKKTWKLSSPEFLGERESLRFLGT